MERWKLEELAGADLILDSIYHGGNSGNASDEVLSKLMGVGNSGGFRKKLTCNKDKLAYVVIFTSGEDIDWKDTIDVSTGRFTYFGDNKTGGKELHKTKKGGNAFLREIFDNYQNGNRKVVPPVFVFQKYIKRDMRFLGLAVPGDSRLSPQENLVAVWANKNNFRYQNYKSIFTILDVTTISREWIIDLQNGNGYRSDKAPEVWTKWVNKGIYTPLVTRKVIEHRTMLEQLAEGDSKRMLSRLLKYFESGQSFEPCAAKIAQFMDSNIVSYDITRGVKDGGRDAIGKYRIGFPENGIEVDFILEAKYYSESTPVGVKEMSRLISRIKHREFGILVTTSYVGEQAYKEIKEDRHPIIVIVGKDIINILYKVGIGTVEQLQQWLENNFDK